MRHNLGLKGWFSGVRSKRASAPVLALAVAVLASASALAVSAPTSAQPLSEPQFTYVDAVDMSLAAPIILTAQVKKSTALSRERVPNLPRGLARLYIEAEILNKIRGGAMLDEKIRWLVDLPLDSNGNPPKLKKQQVMIFAYPIALDSTAANQSANQNANRSPQSQANQQWARDRVQLIAADAQFAYRPETLGLVQQVLAEIDSPDAPAAIVDINSAYHIEGNLPDSGETQIFLDTANGEPIALTILETANGAQRWSATYGEIIDPQAQPPRRHSLAWYRLACGLPERLSRKAMPRSTPASREQAQAHYRYVKEQLGACLRSRQPPPRR